MQTIKLGKTLYVTNRDDILSHHAKCTGKHRIVKSKGAELRRFPDYWDGMSTAEYVAMYYGLNSTASRFHRLRARPMALGTR